MTISTTASRVTLQGNGVTTVFTFQFLIPTAANLIVQILDATVSPAILTTLSSTQYTATGLGNPAGGTVTYPLSGSPLALGQSITIIRQVPYLQLETISNQGNFYPNTVESGLDNLEMQIQQGIDSASRSIQFPPTDPVGLNPVLPPAPNRANMLCGFDSQGNVIATFTGASAPISAAMAPVVNASSRVGAVSLLQYSNQQAVGPTPRFLNAKLSDFMSLLDFANVDPTGATDSSAGLTNALVSARIGRALYIPPGKYRIDNPIDGTNAYFPILIFGAGSQAPFSFGSMSPVYGNTTLIANAGTGKPLFDFTGSNNVTLRDFAIETWTASAPSTVGLMFGASTAPPLSAWPGGNGIVLEDIGIAMPTGGNCIPLAVTGGCGPFYMRNVWLQGDYGAVISSSNALGVASPFATIRTGVGMGGVIANNVAVLGTGVGPSLYIEGAQGHTWTEFTLVNSNAGGGYSGSNYAMFMQNASGINIKGRVFGWPCAMEGSGFLDGINLSGITAPGSTPVPSGVATILNMLGVTLVNSNFTMEVSVGSLPNTNPFYTSPSGGSPNLTWVKNCTFLFNKALSTLAAFLNCTNTITVPFFNLTFNGDADSPTLTFQINGSGAASGNERYFVNGKSFGSG